MCSFIQSKILRFAFNKEFCFEFKFNHKSTIIINAVLSAFSFMKYSFLQLAILIFD